MLTPGHRMMHRVYHSTLHALGVLFLQPALPASASSQNSGFRKGRYCNNCACTVRVVRHASSCYSPSRVQHHGAGQI